MDTSQVPGPGGNNEPVLPMFIQLNARLAEEDDQWKEVSRWVKFQENVEDGGNRWSKPFVPASSYSVFSDLKDGLQAGCVKLDTKGKDIEEIVDDVLGTEASSHLNAHQKLQIKELFEQGVKTKMKMKFGRQFSKQSVGSMKESKSSKIDFEFENDDNLDDGDVFQDQPTGKSAPTTPETKRKESTPISPKNRTYTVGNQDKPDRRKSSGRKVSIKDENLKSRGHNLFSKKVPKDAEACNIQVATCNFLQETFVAFLRLTDPLLLEDFCEIEKPTRFLVLLLGPEGDGKRLVSMGRAVGSMMADQIFCQMTAYKARNITQLLSGLDIYMSELTVMPPSWDPSHRLDPPKTSTTREEREKARKEIKEKKKREKEKENAGNDKEEESSDDDDEPRDIITQEAEDDSLQFTGRLFGGLIADVKRKLPWFVSDFKDAFHIQTLSSIIYIYLATVTKAITFGGFLGDITNGLQGVLESFLGHLLAGGVFCLFAGQPLTVLGCTGPVLIFEKILMDFCNSYGFYYLTTRLWIGLWSALFCIVIVAIDGSAIVRYFTRFTEEAFASLVGIIFIVESLKKIFKMSKTYKVHKYFDVDDLTTEDPCRCSSPSSGVSIFSNISFASQKELKILDEYNISQNGIVKSAGQIDWPNLKRSECEAFGGELSYSCKYSPDIFFLSLFLFFGTFLLCTSLKKFKYTPYFPAKIRSLVTDYAVIITITIFVLIDNYFGLATPKLEVPTKFKPTSDERDWWIPLFDDNSPWYVYILTSIPALLLTILLFMDQQITSVIVNRKEHKLKKGCGYHLDMLVVGIMIGVCSLLGLPWCVAATVLCLGHVDSLKKDSQSTAPGETPQFEGVREQRVTGICVFLLTGLSVTLAPILLYIPMPVLYGVLMYMGVNTLKGMQFIDRIFLIFMPLKHQPDYSYLRHVPLKKVHLFTFIQAGSLAALWIIKSTPASLVFPLMVLALVGFRKAMDYFPSVFSQKELYWLDNLMPASNKKPKKGKKEKKRKSETGSGSNEEKEALKNGSMTEC